MIAVRVLDSVSDLLCDPQDKLDELAGRAVRAMFRVRTVVNGDVQLPQNASARQAHLWAHIALNAVQGVKQYPFFQSLQPPPPCSLDMPGSMSGPPSSEKQVIAVASFSLSKADDLLAQYPQPPKEEEPFFTDKPADIDFAGVVAFI